ncbi:hypothetical protein FSC37_01750 [Piscinibacter aquaticus]|uniref:Uncharacterized protein n=1 Tax=Piscinibacter aquaticus TaxID=392597 RepID=A0A5C6TXN9_9BURK|nr:hypothetical protein FSC37_01750 [Piscinibacter aquaticus]
MAEPTVRRPAWGRWLTLLAVALAVLAVAAAGALWLLRTEAGATWALARVPGLQASGVSGALFGDLRVQRLRIELPRGGEAVLDGASWTGLRIERAAAWRPRVVMDRLAADRIAIRPGAASDAPPSPPASLAVPLELRVEAIEVGLLAIAPLGDLPIERLRARLHIGADDGSMHRLDALSLAYGRLRLQGEATLGADSPMPLQASLSAEQEGALANAQWSARATLAGELTALRLQATLRAQPQAPAGAQPLPPQALDLDVTLKPFERWPLGNLQARAQRLDLSAFHAAAPLTALSGRPVPARRAAISRPRSTRAGQRRAGRLERGPAAAAPAGARSARPPRRPADAGIAHAERRARQPEAGGRAYRGPRALVTRGLDAGRHHLRAAARPARRARAGDAARRPAGAGRQRAGRRIGARHRARRSLGQRARPRCRSSRAAARRRPLAARRHHRPHRAGPRPRRAPPAPRPRSPATPPAARPRRPGS